VIVCTPVGQIAADVRAAANACRPGTLFTDVGSTKAEIVAALEGILPRQSRFVGSHPLAGGEKSGPEAASADLFVDRTVVITPTPATHEDDVVAVRSFWTGLGANVVCMSADEHDRILAVTSHLPHLAAAALAAATPVEALPLAASGWLDTTRVAAGDAELWKQILLANRSNVLTALGRYGKTLTSFRRALERGDNARLVELLAEAKLRRDSLGNAGA
jgi:prephenate dehydrogenase